MSNGTANSFLWTSLGLVGPLAARVSGSVPRGGVTGISIDTRTLQKGDLFFAIKGPSSDGHDYAGAAFEKGAVAAVVDEAHAEALRPLGPLYVVSDVLPALERLGVAARARAPARIVAVTGSAGKTSTKEAVRLVLTQAGLPRAGCLVQQSLGRAAHPGANAETYKLRIYEIGMNHQGEITPLSAMVRPHVPRDQQRQ
jgi:UDP-N-acetylmuramoyl-tripeptide--D-alanyl-D-alanine ligase